MKQRGRKSAAELALTRHQSWRTGDDQPSSSARDLPEAPDHLRPATRAWWTAAVSAYEFQPHEFRSLQTACEAWDRKEQAREAIAQHGLSRCIKATNSAGAGNVTLAPEAVRM